jgi:hypothetical protein
VQFATFDLRADGGSEQLNFDSVIIVLVAEVGKKIVPFGSGYFSSMCLIHVASSGGRVLNGKTRPGVAF